MIPNNLLTTDFIISGDIETSRTYKLTSRNIRGYIDELEALQQAIYKVLNTEKYGYPIYGFRHGIELESLIGKDVAYVRFELKRRIQECLLQDNRILGVENFEFSSLGNSLSCTFDVASIYGNTIITKEVTF